MSWEEVRLEDITSIIGDGLHGTPAYDENGEYYFINGNNLEDGKIILKNGTKRISEEEYNKIKKNLSNRTIFIGINGTLGNLAIYNNEKVALGKSACYLNIKNDVNKLFIYYILKNYDFQDYAGLFATGATIKNLSLKAIRNYKFKLPSLNIQQKIVNLISNYDNLIENNNKRIKLLENMAEELYKEWFVRLRFPNYQNTKIVDGIPEGWEKKKLNNYLKFFRGKSYSSEDIEKEEGLPFVNLKCINRNGGFRRDGLKVFGGKFQGTNIAYSGDIIMAVTDMTQDRAIVGRVGRIPKMNYEKFIFSMDTIRIEPIDIEKIFLYILLRFSNIGLYLKEFANGANVLHLTPDIIYKIDALIPTSKIQIQFTNILKPILDEIDILELKNQNLKETRDLLLPRLISGKLDIKNLDIV